MSASKQLADWLYSEREKGRAEGRVDGIKEAAEVARSFCDRAALNGSTHEAFAMDNRAGNIYSAIQALLLEHPMTRDRESGQ